MSHAPNDSVPGCVEPFAHQRHVVPALDRATGWGEMAEIASERDHPPGRGQFLWGDSARAIIADIEAVS